MVSQPSTSRPSTPERGSAEWLWDLTADGYNTMANLNSLCGEERPLTPAEMARVRELGAELKRIAGEMEG